MRRVLDEIPVTTLDAYRTAGGGDAVVAARGVEAEALIEVVEASGLRGRGGAGFPTGTKWRTVAGFASPTTPTTVVVNGAEGEPGSFKDRAILRSNPYRVLEGALVAAAAVGADRIVVALKSTFTTERTILERAIAEMRAAGWMDGVDLALGLGPGEYLFGEETALLEVLDGRAPFPRITPPWRRGVEEDADEGISSADQTLASEAGTETPPTLVDNVETLANIPGIVMNGPEWFREAGTPRSPGTIVCTVTGDMARHGVVEVPMGTPLVEVLNRVGGGLPAGRRIKAVLSGVANPFLLGDQLETPLTYEDMAAAGAGLGAAGFIVFDDTRDMVAVTQAVSRFLAVESCGQCRPCKLDGLAMSGLLADLAGAEPGTAPRPEVTAELADRVGTVGIGARCNLASQQELVVGSLLARFPDEVAAHADAVADAAEPVVIAPIVDIADDRAVLDEAQLGKQPDWTFDDTDSGQLPAERLAQRSE